MNAIEFLGRLRDRTGIPGTDEALRATGAALETLGERLQGNEPGQMAAQLPPEIAQYLHRPGAGGGEEFPVDVFFERVAEREGVAMDEAADHARAVIKVVAETVSRGELEDVRAQLPPDYARLFDGIGGPVV